MADYKYEALSGCKFTRWPSVVINNPYDGMPSITCVEENVFVLGSDVTITPSNNLTFSFDPSFTFPLYDKQTGDVLEESVSGLDVYNMIYSYILERARLRDEAAAALAT